MASLLERLFPRPQPAALPVKAVTGPGVVAMTYDVPLTSLSRTPQKMAAEAQKIYHSHVWVNAAERLISGKASTVKWHLENDAGDTVEDTHPAALLLERPNDQMTRRQLWALTFRHLGLCGDAFWYLDSLAPDGSATGIYYINPARMWPASDRAGNLVGWVMDADRAEQRQPVAFSVDEILHFVLDPADMGHFGIGLVEAAWSKLELGRVADIHAAKSVASGGRKPGIISPTDGKTFSEDEYQAIVRELRNVTDSPDAAKKSLIFKAPVDYQDAGFAPSQLDLSGLMRMSRDDVLAAWAVPPSMLGITAARGLNSGQTQKFEEAALWQNAIEPRIEAFREVVQFRYLDRFGVELELHVPEFDDQQPLYDIAAKAINLPLTNNQRLALVGLPPIEDETIGGAIYLPTTLAAIGNNPTSNDNDEQIESGGEVKARLTFTALRDKIEKADLPKLRRAVEEALTEQRKELASRVERFYPQIVSKSDHTVWWNEEREYRRLAAALAPVVDDIAATVSSRTSATFFRPPAKASLLERVLEFVRHRTGIRIKGINDTTREAVREAVEVGIRDGLSPRELASNIESLGEFNDARAERIARTETGYALNDGALSTYREFDVRYVEVMDGDQDETCANANGSRWTLEEAESDPLGHPNCTRDFAPVVKAELPPDPLLETIGALKALAEKPAGEMHFHNSVNVPEQPPVVNQFTLPEQPAPVVHNTVNVPKQEPPVVNNTLNVPETVVNVEAAKALGPQEVAVTSMPDRVHRVVRQNGQVTGSVESDEQ